MAISLPIVSKFDDKGVNQAESGLEKLKGFAKGAGIAVAASLAVAGAAAVAFGIESLKAAAEAEAITRGLENAAKNAGVFGDRADQIAKATRVLDDHSKKLGELTGIDDELISQLKTGWLAVPDLAAKGTDGINKLATAAADIAKGTGKDISAVAMAFTRVAGDSETALSKLTRIGIVLSDQQKQTYDDILATNGEIAAQDYLITTLGDKYKGAAEAAANPFDRLDVIFGNLKETIGGALLPAFETLVPQFQTLIEDMVASPEFEQFMEDLSFHFGNMAENLPGVVTNLGSFVRDIMPVFNELGGLAASIVTLMSSGFKDIENSDPASSTNDFATSMQNVANGFSAISGAIRGITSAYNSLPAPLRAFISPLLSGVNFTNLKMPSGATLGDSINRFFKVPQITSLFEKGITGFFPGQANGGTTIRPGLSWVGENGPELMSMPRGASIIPLDRVGSSGGGNVFNINVNAGMGTDGAAVGEQIVNAIRRYERTSGAVFARA
jgi:hypothetical protein